MLLKNDEHQSFLPKLPIQSQINPFQSLKNLNIGSILNSGLLNTNQIELFAPMIQQMTGIDKSTILHIIEIGKALLTTGKLFIEIFKFLARYSGIFTGFSWIIYTIIYT
jgi:hypothetical protein